MILYGYFSEFNLENGPSSEGTFRGLKARTPGLEPLALNFWRVGLTRADHTLAQAPRLRRRPWPLGRPGPHSKGAARPRHNMEASEPARVGPTLQESGAPRSLEVRAAADSHDCRFPEARSDSLEPDTARCFRRRASQQHGEVDTAAPHGAT